MGHRVSTPLKEDNNGATTTGGAQPTMSSSCHRQQHHQQRRRRRGLPPHLTVAILFCAATNTMASSTTSAFATNVRRGCSTKVAIGPRHSVDCPEVAKYNVRFRNSKTKLSSIYKTKKRSKNRNRWSVVSYTGGRYGGLCDSCRSSRSVGGPLHLANPVVPSSSPVSWFATSKGSERYPNRVRKDHRHKNRKSTNNPISSAAQIHCDDALIKRIMKGKKSRSPRWRKRTRRAAASFGFRLEGCDESLPLVPFSNDVVDDFISDLNAKHANGARLRRRRGRRKRRLQDHSLYHVTSPHNLTPEQYDVRRNLWASRYTSLPTLRSTFGTNRNKLWGDFDPSTTRRLYNTLLPRALLGLYEMGLGGPKDLAPLAYEARMTAKKYARERCVVPGRVVAMMYDGFRSWREWGTWNFEGMSWEQIWYKYERQILEEMVREDGLDENYLNLERETEELTAQICLRILERSCITNERINELLISGKEDEKMEYECNKRTKRRRNAERYLGMISSQLDKDMEELMLMEENGGIGEQETDYPIVNYDPLMN